MINVSAGRATRGADGEERAGTRVAPYRWWALLAVVVVVVVGTAGWLADNAPGDAVAGLVLNGNATRR